MINAFALLLEADFCCLEKKCLRDNICFPCNIKWIYSLVIYNLIRITISLSPLMFSVKRATDTAGILAPWGPVHITVTIWLTGCTRSYQWSSSMVNIRRIIMEYCFSAQLLATFCAQGKYKRRQNFITESGTSLSHGLKRQKDGVLLWTYS